MLQHIFKTFKTLDFYVNRELQYKKYAKVNYIVLKLSVATTVPVVYT